jgi:hypothetical protein
LPMLQLARFALLCLTWPRGLRFLILDGIWVGGMVPTEREEFGFVREPIRRYALSGSFCTNLVPPNGRSVSSTRFRFTSHRCGNSFMRADRKVAKVAVLFLDELSLQCGSALSTEMAKITS